MEKKFQEIQDKQQMMENELKLLEKSIFDNETKYLEDTAYIGNVIKGWEGYLATKNSKINNTLPRKGKINQGDRIFSQSSKTSPFVQEVVQQQQQTTLQQKGYQNEGSGEELKEYHFRRTKVKNYAKKNDPNYHSPNSSSDDYPILEKKVKGSKKF